MATIKINLKQLKQVDFPNESSKSLSLNLLNKHFKFESIEEKINIIQKVLNDPESFQEDPILYPLSRSIIGKIEMKTDYEVHMLKNNGEFQIYGERNISLPVIEQMKDAMKLPIAAKGALMPDAHHGYGLPIGAVLAAENAVIPFGVGLDIGCRMALSVYEMPKDFFKRKPFEIRKAIFKHTHFGNDGSLEYRQDHEVLEHPDFSATDLLKRLHGKAAFQLGSSGTGNHFVEFGEVELFENNALQLPAGIYLGLLSHSGSRGMGAAIAAYYTKRATESCKLPDKMRSMAWLDMNSQEGQEYWISMNLAGEYAKACHDCIHRNLTRVMGLNTLIKVENHHNFAWKEIHDGKEFYVHRKGATPAAMGELGIIPGSMTAKGFIVSGKGNPGSLNSASHGAGRKFSRRQTKENFTKSQLNHLLLENGVTLYGGSVEETPQAYKNIEQVMGFQNELVNVEGVFTPKVVRMNKG